MTTPTDSEAVANALTALAEQMKTITTALGTANANNKQRSLTFTNRQHGSTNGCPETIYDCTRG